MFPLACFSLCFPLKLIWYPSQEDFYGKTVITATRETVELESDEILRDADQVDVAFLVVGDPLGYVAHA